MSGIKFYCLTVLATLISTPPNTPRKCSSYAQHKQHAHLPAHDACGQRCTARFLPSLFERGLNHTPLQKSLSANGASSTVKLTRIAFHSQFYTTAGATGKMQVHRNMIRVNVLFQMPVPDNYMGRVKRTRERHKERERKRN